MTLSPATRDWHERSTEERRKNRVQACIERTHERLAAAMQRADERHEAMTDPRR